jgi:lipopolysaccharide/colanic/teichoic acid biosynthesis glycosyltransferase
MQTKSNEHKLEQEQLTVPATEGSIIIPSESPAVELSIGKLFTYRPWKSLFDRLVGLLGIVGLSPLLILIAILIRLDSPGNPVFSQERVGKDGKRFLIYKFRSMYLVHDDSAYKDLLESYIAGDTTCEKYQQAREAIRPGNDPRITRVGAILRKTNLDELPQLINLLKGEMSLVGPRPDIPFSVSMYQACHHKRFEVTPGITGLWQVGERKQVSFEDMIRLDMEYIEKQSLFLDVKIMLMTVRTILRGEGS